MTRTLRDGRVYRGDMGASARKAHRTRRQQELAAGKTISKRTFGVEIEYHSEWPVTKRVVAEAIEQAIGGHVHVTDYHGRTCLRCARPVGYREWKIERDGSLDQRGTGLESTTGEVVSPVLSGQAGLDKLKIVLKAMRDAGCKVDARCGFHVHIGLRDLSRESLERLVRAYFKREREFISLVPRGRRNTTYAKPWMRVFRPLDADDMVQRAFRTLDHAEDFHKYTILNLAPYKRIGTGEFRIHQGTLNFKKAEAWIQFLLAFVDATADANNELAENGLWLWEFLADQKYLPPAAMANLAQRQITYA